MTDSAQPQQQGIDYARIFVKSGHGGNGAVSFRREKYVPRGGPDGGDGGRGGSVYLVGDAGMNTLLRFRDKRRFEAESGGAGGGQKRHGQAGQDPTIARPVGTVVRDAATGEQLADVTATGQPIMVARGGRGGLGHFDLATSDRPLAASAQQ